MYFRKEIIFGLENTYHLKSFIHFSKRLKLSKMKIGFVSKWQVSSTEMFPFWWYWAVLEYHPFIIVTTYNAKRGYFQNQGWHICKLLKGDSLNFRNFLMQIWNFLWDGRQVWIGRCRDSRNRGLTPRGSFHLSHYIALRQPPQYF